VGQGNRRLFHPASDHRRHAQKQLISSRSPVFQGKKRHFWARKWAKMKVCRYHLINMKKLQRSYPKRVTGNS
jgi:hypothetical protein